MEQTPKPAKKDKGREKSKKKKKDKGKQPAELVDLSSPPPTSSGTSSRAPSNNPVTPSREQPSKYGSPSTAQGEKPGTSKNVYPRAHHDHCSYRSKQLPLFSSSNPIDPPRAGANASSLHAIRAAITAERPQTNDTERSSYSNECKIKTLEMCLSLKDRYLALPPASQADQEPFWSRLLDMLELMPLTKGKFNEWKEANRAVENWCQNRRSSLRENRLPAVSQSHPELDSLIDQWNLVFARRFCKIYGGYFATTTWPRIPLDRLKQMVNDRVDSWISDSLKKRREELQRHARPALLSSNSSLADYDNAIKGLQNQSEALKKDETQVRESEAVMSFVLELRPGLSTAIGQCLGDQDNSMRHTGLTAGTQQQNGSEELRGRVSFTIPPTGASVKAAPPAPLGPPTSTSFPAYQGPITNPTSRLEKPVSQSSQSGPATIPPEESGEHSSRKRKDVEPPTRSPTRSFHAIANSSNSIVSLKRPSSSNRTSHNQEKRPRLDNGPNNLPPATDFTLQDKDIRDSGSSPSRRPSSPQRLCSSYGSTRKDEQGAPRNPNKIPLATPSSARPSSSTWSQSEPPRHRPDSPGTSGRFHPPRYPSQHPPDSWRRQRDSYRPQP